MSAVSTADTLSEKKYDYFMRMVSPDRYQAEAIISLIRHFGWTYFSLLYSQGSYGVGGMERLVTLAKDTGVCIAYSLKLRSDTSDENNNDIIKALRRNSAARVVVLFANAPEAKKVLEAAHRGKSHGEFIWITSDGLSSLSSVSRITDIVQGAFMVSMYSVSHPYFDKYFTSLNPSTNPKNPWFRKFWELQFDCTFSDMNETQKCIGNETIGLNNGYKQDKRVSLFVDAVETLARGLHNLLEKKCPEAFGDHVLMKNCITGESLMDRLLKTNFSGTIGNVAFDSNGDLFGKYVVNHVKYSNITGYILEPVAVWSKEDGIVVNNSLISWNLRGKGKGKSDVVPESVCSKPCARGQIYLKQELPCCWTCHTCGENEITDLNYTTCVACTEGTWPSKYRLNCVRIEPEYLTFPQTFAIALVVLAVIGILSCIGTFSVWIMHRKDKLIKASCQELSLLILSGLFLSFLTSVSYLFPPGNASCIISRVGFHISFTITYAPLLLRTCRIYRIFELSRRNAQMPALIGNKIQVLVSMIVIVFQVFCL